MRNLFNTKGFTLIEIMIAVVILSIAVTFIYATFISQQNSALVQEDVSDVQQNARIVMDMLTRDIRGAGVGQIPGPVTTSQNSPTITASNYLILKSVTSTYVITATTSGSNVTVQVFSTKGFNPGDSVNFIQTSNYQSTTANNITVADSTHIFYSGSTPAPQPGYLVTDATNITYGLIGNTLYRNNQAVADNIQSLVVPPPSLPLVQLNLTAQTSKAVSNQYNGSPRTRTFISNVMVRQ